MIFLLIARAKRRRLNKIGSTCKRSQSPIEDALLVSL